MVISAKSGYCKSQNSAGEIGTEIWLDKCLDKRGFGKGATRRVILLSPTEFWDLHLGFAINSSIPCVLSFIPLSSRIRCNRIARLIDKLAVPRCSVPGG